MQQAYVSSGHQMAPPSPNTNSGSNSSGMGGEQLSKTNLYIRGLHPGTTDQDLVKLCQPWVICDYFEKKYDSQLESKIYFWKQYNVKYERMWHYYYLFFLLFFTFF